MTVQRLLAAIVCCFVVATCYISVVIFERQAALHKISRYNAAWTVSQTLSEFLRLERALASYRVPTAGVDLDEVQLRLDIMFSRLSTFEKGAKEEIGEGRSIRLFVRSQPGNEEAIRRLRERLEAVDAIVGADAGTFDVGSALRLLEPLGAELTALASRAAAHGAARAAEDRRELERLHLLFTGLAWGLILCGIGLILLLVRQNRLLGQTHESLSATAAQLAETHGVLTLQNQRFDAALNNLSQALCTCDSLGRIVVFNHRFVSLLGTPCAPGSLLVEVLAAARRTTSTTALEELYRHQAPLIVEGQKGAFTLDVRDGRSFAVSHEPLADGGWLATYEDVSLRRRVEAHILHMAHHDALTDLPNRTLLHEWLEERCATLEAEDEPVTVILLDLDGFKEVNDTLGHHFGDQILKSVAKRLRACAPNPERLARLGGDEFALLMPRACTLKEGFAVAEQTLAAIAEIYSVDGHQVVLGASIGIAHERHASRTPEQLLKHADLAMYQAKADGKGRISQFIPQMESRLQARKSLEADLREALPRREMEVHYQPLLDTQTRRVQGYEALLRWKRRGGGYVSPVDFIPVAEETGLIDSLGEWVLREACREASTWCPEISLAVNLSPVQFRSGNIVQTVLRVLADTCMSPQRLELEVTESVLLEANEKTLLALHQLRKLGLRIALDDFGTGYSSLSYLSRFRFDKIKIDKGFIQNMTDSSDASAIVEIATDLGRKLGIRTTAEGVETEEQLGYLQTIGCTQVQGYLFSRPKPASELDVSRSGTAARVPNEPVAVEVVNVSRG